MLVINLKTRLKIHSVLKSKAILEYSLINLYYLYFEYEFNIYRFNYPNISWNQIHVFELEWNLLILDEYI